MTEEVKLTERTEAEVEELIVELRPLITYLAWERTTGCQWLREDTVQEGLIALWTRLAEGKPVGMAVFNAKQAMIDLVRGGRTTGSKKTAGGRGAALGAHARAIPLTQPSADDGGDEYVIEPVDQDATAAYDAVDFEAELASLLEVLTPQQRTLVRQRMEGYTTAEIGRQEGVTPQAISVRVGKIRRALEPRLSRTA